MKRVFSVPIVNWKINCVSCECRSFCHLRKSSNSKSYGYWKERRKYNGYLMDSLMCYYQHSSCYSRNTNEAYMIHRHHAYQRMGWEYFDNVAEICITAAGASY